jgi:hypothetical protein
MTPDHEKQLAALAHRLLMKATDWTPAWYDFEARVEKLHGSSYAHTGRCWDIFTNAARDSDDIRARIASGKLATDAEMQSTIFARVRAANTLSDELDSERKRLGIKRR